MIRWILALLGAAGALGALRIRQVSRAAYERYEQAIEAVLEPLALRPKHFAHDELVLRPRRALGTMAFIAKVAAGERVRHMCLDNVSFAGLFQILTLVLVPDYRYNLPMFIADVVCAGKRRALYFGVIDPAHVPADHLEDGYRMLREYKQRAEDEVLVQDVETSSWARDMVPGTCMRIISDQSHEDALLKLVTDYLETWLAMAQKAPLAAPAVQRQVAEGIEAYVNTLLEKGGPSSDFLKLLVGPEQQQLRTRNITFGTQEPVLQH